MAAYENRKLVSASGGAAAAGGSAGAMWESAGARTAPHPEEQIVACQTGPLSVSGAERCLWHAHLVLSLQQEHAAGGNVEYAARGAAPRAAKNTSSTVETQRRAGAEALNAPSRRNAEMRAKGCIRKQDGSTDTARADACQECYRKRGLVREPEEGAGMSSTKPEWRCERKIRRPAAARRCPQLRMSRMWSVQPEARIRGLRRRSHRNSRVPR